MRITKRNIVFLPLAIMLTGCSIASSYGENNYQIQKMAVFANDCQDPRETIILHPDGQGTAKLKDMPEKPISWSQQGRIVTLKNDAIQTIAYVDDQKNLTIESSNKAKNKNIPLHERIRYRCLKKDT